MNSGKDVSVVARRPFVQASLLGAGVLTLSACGGEGSDSAQPDSSQSSSATPSPTPTKNFAGSVEVVPAAEQVEINPVDPVTVSVTGGKFTSVEVVTMDAQEHPVPAVGELNSEKTVWTSADPLLFNSEYTVRWHAEDSEGTAGTGESTFSTVSAANEADVMTNIAEGAEYGVGQIIELNFSEPVVNKAEVEKAIVVTGGGDMPGKIRWYSDTMARYRPQNYWAPRSSVNVKVNILGMDLGNGMIGNSNLQRNFTVGEKRYALADDSTKTIKLYVNDKMVRENPITLGNSDWPSVIGKLVVMEQAEKYFFNPSSLNLVPGEAHYYEPFWATNVSRLTASGVFVHQALPSAYSSIGVVNVSHGCIGMLLEDAAYFFDVFAPGDVVETVNTGYLQADPDDGYGDWNIPFEKYQDASWKGNW